MKKAIKIALTILLFSSAFVQAQDAQFSQFYASPMYLNPAFAGNTIQSRFSLNYRNQWASVPGAFKTYAVGYDHNFRKYNSGVGLMILHDKAGSAGMSLTSVNFFYAYTFQISRKTILKTGLRFAQNTRGLDVNRLTFGDQLARGGALTSVESNILNSTSYFDVGAGIIFAKQEQYWIGAALDHIDQQNRALVSAGQTNISRKLSIHGGYKFALKKTTRGVPLTSITVAANYKQQQKWNQFDVGAYYYKKPLILGLWFRGIPIMKTFGKNSNRDALTFLVGYEIENMRIGYTYDYTISRLTNSTNNGSGGSHEISIIFEFANKRNKRIKNRKRFQVPCAKF